MNTAIRRVALAAIVMVVALLAQLTWVQVFRADELRADARNTRMLLDEYSRQRGQITAGGRVLAMSQPSDGRYEYGQLPDELWERPAIRCRKKSCRTR